VRFLLLALLLCSCSSGTQEIADSASAISSQAQSITDKARELTVLAGQIDENLAAAQGYLAGEQQDPGKAVERIEASRLVVSDVTGKADEIMVLSSEIHAETTDIVGSLPSVKDTTPWWASLISLVVGLGLMALAAFMLVHTGIGASLGALLRSLIPKRRSK
jgi:hypothetical protein